MRTHTFTSVCAGLIVAALTTAIGFEGIATARPNASSGVEIVNRLRKGDRLPVVQTDVQRAPTYNSGLPEGCDPLVSSLTLSPLIRIARHCVS